MKNKIILLNLYLLFSAVSFSLFAQQSVKVLAIGNSFSADAVEEFLDGLSTEGGLSLIHIFVIKKDVDAIKNEKHKSVVNYYNGFYNKYILKQQMQVAINRATELGLKLYCSEYGCISNTNKEVKQRWIHDVAEIFRENDIAFSIWGWKANFGLSLIHIWQPSVKNIMLHFPYGDIKPDLV